MDHLRRQIIQQALKVTGTAVLTGDILFNTHMAERLSRVLTKPSSIDEKMLSYLELRTDNYWQDRHGAVLASPDLLRYVLEHFQKIIEILEGSLFPAQRIQLCSIASKTALLVGELFLDMGYYGQARSFDEVVITAAQEANDQILEAISRGRMSLAWTYSKNFQKALTNIQEARYLATGVANVTACSWLAAIEAEAQANHHNHNACLKALDEAERIEDQQYISEDSCLIYFDRSLLRGYQGVCFRLLYHPNDTQRTIYLDKAQQVLLDSLQLLDQMKIQRQPTFLTDLADTYLQQGEIEVACERAAQAAAIASQIKLQKVLQRLRQLRFALEPWNDTPSVKNFDQYLVALSI